MAPSATGLGPAEQKQSTILGFGRISKTTPSSVNSKSTPKQAAALAQLLEESSLQSPPRINRKGNDAQTPSTATSKRKRKDSDCEYLPDLGRLLPRAEIAKKVRCWQHRPGQFHRVFTDRMQVKLQLPSPPPSSGASSDEDRPASVYKRPSTASSESFPQSLCDVVDIHAAFLKAFSIHSIHNGQSSPAELESLLYTITTLWKKRQVLEEDIRRVLALWEASGEADIAMGDKVPHNLGPFKLTVSWVGSSSRNYVEFVGTGRFSHNGNNYPLRGLSHGDLQAKYVAHVSGLFRVSSQSANSRLQFIHGHLSEYPLLTDSFDTHTAARNEKTLLRRKEVLDISDNTQKSNQFNANVIPPRASKLPEMGEMDKLKFRTSSLFDRVKAKQLANAANAAPTAEVVLRRRAIGRIAEIVEILRMKQQQRLGSQCRLANDENVVKPSSKISFSMTQLIYDVKNSVAVPIVNEEVHECLRLIAEAIPSPWISIFEWGAGENKVTSVTLNGPGMSGRDVQMILQKTLE